LKLLKYNQAIERFHLALVIAKEELILFGFISLMLLYISAVGIYYFENTSQPEQFKPVFHSLWWAVTTLTTVGYGDMYPITAGGRLVTFFVLVTGLGIVAVPTGLIASALSQVRARNDIGLSFTDHVTDNGENMVKITLKKTPKGKTSLMLADNGHHIIRVTNTDKMPYQEGSQRARAWQVISLMDGLTVEKGHEIMKALEPNIQRSNGRSPGWIRDVVDIGHVEIHKSKKRS
jgi:hypothetical protein